MIFVLFIIIYYTWFLEVDPDPAKDTDPTDPDPQHCEKLACLVKTEQETLE